MRYTVMRTEVFIFYVDEENESDAKEFIGSLDSLELAKIADYSDTDAIEVIFQDEPQRDARFLSAGGEDL